MLILFGNQPKIRGYIWFDAVLEATEKIARFRSSVGILQGKVSVLVKASSD